MLLSWNWRHFATILRTPLSCVLVVTAPGSASTARASIADVTAPTTSWTVIQYAANNPDPSNDQQTGSAEGDIVGNALHGSAYTMFGDGNTPSLTDGDLAFRVRVGADGNPAGFKAALFVGIDANNDGALDLFLGINNSGAADHVGIWDPGTGLNISPNTTSIVSTPLASYTETSSNYSWTAVNTTNDPSVGTALDIDGGGDNDYFLSFSVPFIDVVTQLAANGISGFNENSPLSYVISTATQANSLNQDLNGVDKNYDVNATWSTLGVVSNGMYPTGASVVPEANAGLAVPLLGALVIGQKAYRRRRARRSGVMA